MFNYQILKVFYYELNWLQEIFVNNFAFSQDALKQYKNLQIPDT